MSDFDLYRECGLYVDSWVDNGRMSTQTVNRAQDELVKLVTRAVEARTDELRSEYDYVAQLVKDNLSPQKGGLE